MLGFLGGTGPEGRGLALRFALAGEKVFIGSRDISRGKAAAN
ncbi:NADPH-dependent F420 reductase, partial [SAR202 cluster bacterium AD-802-K11_MRT_200m]|nr:NADPH-dependent F420 reductase [SAR202 cluster bacterium AD-802-K11_MRT_200m]